ncbi:MAG: hypothetical protein FWE86_02705, partial [Oscillospiraceae bacterium]|nr:hypothetical protein [Oscillospiraceae bacterium]
MKKTAKKLVAAFLFVLLILTVFPVMTASAAAGFAGGSGAAANPYLIETAQQLDAVRKNPKASYKLIADIDLTDFLSDKPTGWDAIPSSRGSSNKSFSGSLDGDGHVISGLWTEAEDVDIGDPHFFNGLFSFISGNATIKNLGLILGKKGINVTSDWSMTAGGLASYAHIQSNKTITVENCFVSGDISCNSVSGLIGGISNSGYRGVKNAKCNISNCYYEGTLKGNFFNMIASVGLSSATDRIVIENCYAKGIAEKNYTWAAPFVSVSFYDFYTANLSSENISINNCHMSVEDAFGDKFDEEYLPYYHGVTFAEINFFNKIEPFFDFFSNCYYDSDKAPGASCTYVNYEDYSGSTEERFTTPGISGLSTEEMARFSSFSGFDSDVWGIFEGHGAPYLKSFDNAALALPPEDILFRPEAFEVTSYDVEGVLESVSG